MKKIKSKREQIPANAFRTSIQSPLRRMAHVATRHSSQFVPPHNPVPHRWWWCGQWKMSHPWMFTVIHVPGFREREKRDLATAR
jgi:hypothetical protein